LKFTKKITGIDEISACAVMTAIKRNDG